jgi:hypothetical protein
MNRFREIKNFFIPEKGKICGFDKLKAKFIFGENLPEMEKAYLEYCRDINTSQITFVENTTKTISKTFRILIDAFKSGLNKSDAYTILGVSSNATKQEIKDAYRDLVKIHHPDVGGESEMFIEIQAAYEFLMEKMG